MFSSILKSIIYSAKPLTKVCIIAHKIIETRMGEMEVAMKIVLIWDHVVVLEGGGAQ